MKPEEDALVLLGARLDEAASWWGATALMLGRTTAACKARACELQI